MTPIRPSVSPLHSFAARPDAPRAVLTTPWTKRAARWLVVFRKRAAPPVGKP